MSTSFCDPENSTVTVDSIQVDTVEVFLVWYASLLVVVALKRA